MSEHIISETPAKHVMAIRIVRPEKRNALSNAMVIEIGRLLGEAEADEEIRCAVLTGTNEAFSAGADIAEMRATDSGAVNDPARVAAWHRIERFSKPVIAAVNGYAFGAGNELAMTCDFIIAGENAQFGQPEVNIGGIAGDGGTQRLPRRVGPGLAAYLLMSGVPIDAETALRHGHALEVVASDRTFDRAVEIASLIAFRAPLAVRTSKTCIRIAGETTLEAGIAFERSVLWRILQTPDIVEGGRAFLEKRPPKFTGKWS